MKKKNALIGLVGLLVAALLVLAIYWFLQDKVQRPPLPGSEPEPKGTAQEPSPAPPAERYPISPKPTPQGNASGSTRPANSAAASYAEADPCKKAQEDLRNLCQELDRQKYIQHLELGTDSYTVFQRILGRLASHPPIPAGEGIDPAIILKNIYFFYRTLPHKELRFLREVLMHQSPALELDLHILFRWLDSRLKCPPSRGPRLSLEVLYPYAGFFVNTVGGRAYLSRRPPTMRLLVTYYCVRILHAADLAGKNPYGINVAAFIPSLREEMVRYPDLHFQRDYLQDLEEMEAYYKEKR